MRIGRSYLRVLVGMFVCLVCGGCGLHDYYEVPIGLYDYQRSGEPELLGVARVRGGSDGLRVEQRAAVKEVARRWRVEDRVDKYRYSLVDDVLGEPLVAVFASPCVLADPFLFLLGEKVAPMTSERPKYFFWTRLLIGALVPGYSGTYTNSRPRPNVEVLGSRWVAIADAKYRQSETYVDMPVSGLVLRSSYGYEIGRSKVLDDSAVVRLAKGVSVDEDLKILSERHGVVQLLVPASEEAEVVAALKHDAAYRNRASAAMLAAFDKGFVDLDKVWTSFKPLIIGSHPGSQRVRMLFVDRLVVTARKAVDSAGGNEVVQVVDLLRKLEGECKVCLRRGRSGHVATMVQRRMREQHAAKKHQDVVELGQALSSCMPNYMAAVAREMADSCEHIADAELRGGHSRRGLDWLRRANALHSTSSRAGRIASIEKETARRLRAERGRAAEERRLENEEKQRKREYRNRLIAQFNRQEARKDRERKQARSRRSAASAADNPPTPNDLQRAREPHQPTPKRKPGRIIFPTRPQPQPKADKIELRWFFLTHGAVTGAPGSERPAPHLWYSRPFDYHRSATEWKKLGIVKKRPPTERSVKLLVARDYREFIEAARPKYSQWVYGPVVDRSGGSPIPTSVPGAAVLHGPFKTFSEANRALQSLLSQPAYNQHVEAAKPHKLGWERNESGRTGR